MIDRLVTLCMNVIMGAGAAFVWAFLPRWVFVGWIVTVVLCVADDLRAKEAQ